MKSCGDSDEGVRKQGPNATSVHLELKHGIPVAVEVIFTKGSSDIRSLRSFRFIAAEDLPVPLDYLLREGAKVPQEWASQRIAEVSECSPLNAGAIAELISAPLSRALLTGHLLLIYSKGVPLLEEDESSIIKQTARLYREFTAWGATAPAIHLSNLLHESKMTIRNRLSMARERGWLQSPGSGTRRVRPQ